MKILLLALVLIFTPSAHSQVVFNVPEIDVPVSEYINLPVEIETSGENVGSLEFELNYDSDYLEFVLIDITPKAQEWLTYTMDWQGETVRWGGYDITFGNFTISNTTELFTVRFRVINQDWDTIPITIGRKTAGTEMGLDIEVENTDGYVNKRTSSFDSPSDGINGIAYPVPTRGILNFELTLPGNCDYTIRVLDLNGTLYKRFTKTFFTGYNYFETDLSMLSNGIYLIQITDGNYMKTFKIIKQ